MEEDINKLIRIGECRSCGKDIFSGSKGIGLTQTVCNECRFTFIPDEGDFSFAPKGECEYCDEQREMNSRFAPSHNASSGCRSGGRNHCTCDACF